MAKARRKEEREETALAEQTSRALEFERAVDAWGANCLRLIAEGLALEKSALDAGVPISSRLICIRAALRTYRELYSLQSEVLRVGIIFTAGRTPRPDDDSLKAREAAGQYALKVIPQLQVRYRRWIAQGEMVESQLESIAQANTAAGQENSLVGENIKFDYTSILMPHELPDLETTLRAAAHYSGKSVAAVRAQLGVDDAARETTARATATPRLKWDRDRLPDENPATFAWRAYQAEAKAGRLHMGVIRQEDEPLAVKLVSWLRSPANREQVPEGFDIPTKPEWNTRQLAKLDDGAAREVVRLGRISTVRASRARAASTPGM